MSARQGLPRSDLISGLNGPARTHAVYASSGRSPHRTQDSLPAVGQTLPGGLSVPLGSSERFLRCFLHRFPPFPGLTWRKRSYVDVTGAVWPHCVARGGGPIRRHIKVRGDANPYDPSWEIYYEQRLSAKMTDSQTGRGVMRVLWEGQQGICPQCRQPITRETGWHIHHRHWRVYGGTDVLENLELLHPNCHRQIHSWVWQGTQAVSREGR